MSRRKMFAGKRSDGDEGVDSSPLAETKVLKLSQLMVPLVSQYFFYGELRDQKKYLTVPSYGAA